MKVLHVLYQSIPNTAGSSIRSRDILNSQLREGLRPIAITSPFQPPFVKGSIKEDLDGITYYRTYFGNHDEIVSENISSSSIIPFPSRSTVYVHVHS